MNVRQIARRSLVGSAVAAVTMTGLATGGALAAHAAPAGYVTTYSCTTLAGATTLAPGLLTSTVRPTTAVLSGSLSGCSDIYDGALPGVGSFTAVLSGPASVQAENFAGTFTINWPSGLNPSNGSLSVVDANGVETVSGSVTSGALTGAELSLGYLNTLHKGAGTRKHPVVSQQWVNTAPLALAQNFG